MIRTLTGRPQAFFEEGVVLEVGGVGYEIFLDQPTQRQLETVEQTTLQIYTLVREEALQLFGFRSADERQLFVQLLSVSGVGPKSALHVLANGAAAVRQAIRHSDVAFFQAVPRLGKKTAQKIIVDLQSKLGAEAELDLAPPGSLKHDLREALLGLGYDERSIQSLMRSVDDSWSIEVALKWALRELGAKR